MSIETLKINQSEVIKMIDNSYNKNKLVHAYILEGEPGSGKFDAATYFATKLLCTSYDKPCGKCSNCQRIINSTHTNVIVIEPDAISNTIKKDQIGNLMHEFSMTNLEEGSRVYIIKDADKMNRAASNAILKFLEEPFPNHYALLLTTNANRLLDTIVSRSQLLRLKPLNKGILEKELIEKGVDGDVAYILSNLTSNISAALELVNSGDITNICELVKQINISINEGKDPYIAFLLNNKFLYQSENKDIHYLFMKVLMLFIQEKICYYELKSRDTHFNDIIKNTNFEKENISKLIND